MATLRSHVKFFVKEKRKFFAVQRWQQSNREQLLRMSRREILNADYADYRRAKFNLRKSAKSAFDSLCTNFLPHFTKLIRNADCADYRRVMVPLR